MADGDEDPGNVERTVTDGTDAIWSTDDIPVRDGPLDLTWVAHAAAPDQPISTAHQSPLLDEFVTPSTVGLTSDERSPRSKLLIGGAALVAAAISVGLIVRSGGADETATPETTTDAMSTIDGTTTDPPTTSGAPTTTAATGDSLFDAATVDSIGPINVELPSPVAAIQIPTEVVMLTANGLMHTLSLPSGRVRSVALADDADTSMFNGGNVVVTPEAAAILQAEGGAVVIVPRTGPPINVSMDEFGDAIGGLELHSGLIGLNLGQDLAGFDFVAFLNKPFGQSPLFHRGRQGGHQYFGCHICLSLHVDVGPKLGKLWLGAVFGEFGAFVDDLFDRLVDGLQLFV